MTDNRLSIEFSLSHSHAEPDVLVPLVDKLRRKAIDIGFHLVGELFNLTNDPDTAHIGIPSAVCYFSCSLPGDGPIEIGVERNLTGIECDGFVIPSGLPEWWKCGEMRTIELRLLSKLLHHAAELGFESSLAFCGIALDYRRIGGTVEVKQTWDPFLSAD